jgi:hypothetical protein
VAETSGFTTDLQQSAYLSLSVRRAVSAAQQRSHRYVTLEHLLLALLDDPDAVALLDAIRADIPGIRSSIADTVNRNLATLYTPGQFDLRASYKVERVLQTASDDAARLGCEEVDAGFVLAALSRESDNPAADILKRNGFTYSAALTWLYANRGSSYSSRTAARAQPQAPQQAAPGPAMRPEATPVMAPMAEPEAAHSVEEADISDGMEADEAVELDMEIAEDPAPAAAPKPEPAPSRPAPPERPIAAARAAERYQAAQPVPMGAPASLSPSPSPDRAGGEASPAPRPAEKLPPTAIPRRRDGPVTPPAGAANSDLMRTPILPRQEPQLPPSSRLEEMRLGQTAARPAPPPAPSPAPPPPAPPTAKKRAKAARQQLPAGKTAAPADQANGRSQRRQARPYDAMLGRLIENVPRRMKSAVPERIEVRISREDTQAITRGMEGRAQPVRHDITVTQTMSVALRAPDGGFTIEPLSPETQWIFDRPGAADAETYGRWRWVVTPRSPGQRRLQLIIAARSVSQSGMIGDAALPDQIITVKVRTNYWLSIKSGLKWIAAMAIGGTLTELAMLGVRVLGN